MATALTIAGSDSGGGAGVQADLKTFAAHGVYGTSAITAVTAQNTVDVVSFQPVPAELVTAQIEAVMSDIGADAAKTGMLATAEIVEAVAAAVEALEIPLLVVDPVMVAKSGDDLLAHEALTAMRASLLPLAYVVTPNLPEAAALAQMAIATDADRREAARRLHALGAAHVVIKGGHGEGPEILDLLFDGRAFTEFRGPRVPGSHTHGTGCTFAAAIAANLALHRTLPDAVDRARQYVAGAMRCGIDVGRGHQPLDHFWNVRRAANR